MDKTGHTSDTPLPRRGKGNFLPKPGRWGTGVKTKRIRVPIEIADRLPDELTTLLTALSVRHAMAKGTRNWTEFNRLYEAVEATCPTLIAYAKRSPE